MSTSFKKQKKIKKLDLSPFVNINDGTFLSSELEDAKVEITEESNTVVMTSDNYTIIDVHAMNFLRQYLNRSELGAIGIISSDLKTSYNIVYNNTIPHTNETLQEVLGIASNSTFNLLIKKLMKLSVLYQIKGNIMGRMRVIYMMNPFLARKRKLINENVVNIFSEFKMIKEN